MKYENLSPEQKQFVDYARAGHSILVDACIGSGKTTAIQTLCDLLPKKRILYLTYNKLLKLDAKERITGWQATVTNYHGFAYTELAKHSVYPGITELIQIYNKKKFPVSVPYDVLILDEYQDIDLEISQMLWHIKECCPNIQIVAVGDMQQKIYDRTRLKVQTFIKKFMGEHYIPMEFTWCFRLQPEYAKWLGMKWGKEIVGVNEQCTIEVISPYDAYRIAMHTEPKDLLVLGSKAGDAQNLQNYLESHCPDVFNKSTLWSKIMDHDGGATNPTPQVAVFTTYDGSKGMERDTLLLYDFNEWYWNTRIDKPGTSYEILRNIFLVAASRGKRYIGIVAESPSPYYQDGKLNYRSLLSFLDESENPYDQSFSNMNVSEMFDFKFVEDIEEAYQMLEVKEVQPIGEVIPVPTNDELIDLSPCIGHYIQCLYFEDYHLDEEIEVALNSPGRGYLRRSYAKYSLDQKLLYLTCIETKQQRYMNQVAGLPVTEEQKQQITKRLATHLSPNAPVEVPCELAVQGGEFFINGRMDAIADNMVYELKFVSALSHTHFLQLASYLALKPKYKKGRLWNVRTNQIYEVSVPDRKAFLNQVVKTITKGVYKKI